MVGKVLCTMGLAALLPLGCLAQISEGSKVGINTGTGLNAPRSGVLASGRITFVKVYKPEITKPNYNPGFGTGEKNTIVRLTTDYYAFKFRSSENQFE